MPPSLTIGRSKFKTAPRSSRCKINSDAHHGFSHTQASCEKAVEKALKPIVDGIEVLKTHFGEERKLIFARLAMLEDDIRNLSSMFVHNAGGKWFHNSRSSINTPYGLSLDNIYESAVQDRSRLSFSPVMLDVRQLENRMHKEASVSLEEVSKFSDEIDKTGLSRIRASALRKAAQFQGLSDGPTIGPNAFGNGGGSMDTGLDRFSQIDSMMTPIPRATYRKKAVKSSLLFAEPDEPINEDRFCLRRIQAEMNQLNVKEAQEAKYLHMKLFEEHEKRVLEEVAKRNAQQQAEELARQQVRMQEMALQQEYSLKKQERLIVLQAQRDSEFSRKQEEQKQLQLEAEKLMKDSMKKQNELFSNIYEIHRNFIAQYKEILELLKNEEVKRLVPEELEDIKCCQLSFNVLIDKCKVNHDKLNQDDVLVAQNLLEKIKSYNLKTKNELAKVEANKLKLREHQELLKKMESEKNKLKLEQERKKEEEKKASIIKESGNSSGLVESSSNDVDLEGVVVGSARFVEYKKLQENFDSVNKSIDPLTRDESMKKFRSDCQKAINIPLNAISAQSPAHLMDKYKKLSSFLQNQTVIISDRRITASSHPLGQLFSMNYLAYRVVKQGEQVVSSNPEAAYPLASVVLALWADFPQFGLLLLSHFYKASPYLIPAYWLPQKGEAEEDYYKRLGFLYVNNEREEMDKFLKRQSGIMMLYSAIIVTPHNRANRSKPHPLPVSEAWKWLTTVITLRPKPEISATVLLEMLEITGHLLMSTYRTQFRKLLHLICTSYLPLVEKVTPQGRGGPVTRLRGFLDGLISGKTIPPPKGLLSPNFW